ncbi:phosphoenolpyruvate--protein phosphotransferase [Pseudomonas sp. HR96]|uniref:phosphoenolpyruvate--protein phosphotransferase n=1 Tax=Pseudomonas sp. HR96 TaxID=1027966 RepID=UPI002A763DE0|nr:phosphoenolpyruvate--protein phosphotransferase [Pseudomonas sp. HR96]WPO97867.1 phosphoenolpyruvate--protein phosphotransferase [Pseudomonas sp. HR96]
MLNEPITSVMTVTRTITLDAPFSGPVLPMSEVPDPVFASGAMGDGIAIDPLNDVLHAPFAGQVLSLARTAHAITLRADNGSEWLLHVGIDSVELAGEGFQALVSAGQRVSSGQPLLRIDLDKVAQRSRSLVSAFVLLNGEQYQLTPVAGLCSAMVGDALLQVHPRAASEVVADAAPGPSREARGSVRVAHRGGLHARPAARVRETAKAFASRSQVHFAGASAAAESVTGLMGLGVGQEDEVEVSCLGPDSEAALQALLAALSTPALDEAPTRPAPVSHRGASDSANGVLGGVMAAPGVVSGPLCRLDSWELPSDPGNHVTGEQHLRLGQALAGVHDALTAALDPRQAEQSAILGAHLAMLEDPALLDAAYADIQQGSSAAHAWSRAVLAQCTVLEALDNPLLGERASDLRDLRQRVLQHLLGDSRALHIAPGAIVVAAELTPSQLIELAARGVAGVAMAQGGATSHVAILARSKGLPCLVAMGSALLEDNAADTVVLDADAGQLELRPGRQRLAEVHARMQHQAAQRRRDDQQGNLPAVTRDRQHIEVSANVAGAEDTRQAQAHGADGVGLLRTELLFVDRRTAPSEAEQTQACQAVLDAMADKPVVIRTLDIGGDKQLEYLPLAAEANPVLGLRGIRLGQQRPELLDQQLRALLQVKPLARCRILLPMVSEVAELLAVRLRIDQLAHALGVDERPQLGVMIEVPAAALLAGQLAEHADFLSIGTNDLAQYTLAMDRDHAGLAGRVDALHPAVLRLIAMTCQGAALHGRSVAVCGALASDPLATAALIGLGVNELSVSPGQVGQIKAAVRQLDAGQCRALARRLLELGSADATRAACRAFQPQ